MSAEERARENRRQVDALFAEQSGPRERVVDEHNFTVRGHLVPGTFRVQVFAGANLRPVAVVTQTIDGEGASLINRAEAYAAAVWRTFLPELERPPIWLERQLLTSMEWTDYRLLGFERNGEDGFEVSNDYGASLTQAEAERLVGCPVDPGRGERFARFPEPAPTEEMYYRVAWVAAQPKTRPFRQADECMTPEGTWRRRLLRQLVPRPVLGCDCWYHQGDWRAVSRLAIRLLSEARRAGVADEEFGGWVLDHPETGQLTAWQADALETLVAPYDAIDVSRSGYTNGNHRIRAMLDAGVRRTLVISYRQLLAAAPALDPAADDRRWADEGDRAKRAVLPPPRKDPRRAHR